MTCQDRSRPSLPIRPATALVASLAIASPIASRPLCLDHDPLYRLDGNDFLWSEIAAVSANDSLLSVLVRSDSRIHLFNLADGTPERSWGRDGEGPGEFESSTGVALLGDRLYALDANQARVSVFDFAGDLVRTMGLRDHGISLRAGWLERAGRNALVFGSSQPMADERAISSWSFKIGADEDSVRAQTVIAYERGATMRLTAPEGPPSLTVLLPYSPTPQWTTFGSGVAFWPGPDAEVSILGLDGELQSVISLALDDRFEVTAEDREYWFRNRIPDEIFGQRGVFEPVRREARRTVDFPSHHPLVFELIGGPEGQLWVRRTPDARDQIWDVVDAQGQVAGRVVLAANEELMAVLPGYLIVKVTDDLGVESVDVRSCG